MPCLVVILALCFPRVAIILLALFTGLFTKAFHGEWLWPVLGFIFLPFTLLAYSWAMYSHGSVDGLYLVLVIFAVLADLGVIGGGAKRRKVVVVERRDEIR